MSDELLLILPQFLFVLGLFFGSFLNVCILRIPAGEGITFKRSHCPHCKTTLTAIDLLPVISYILLLGKCRYCKTKISARYMFVEILTAIIFYIGAQNFKTDYWSLLIFLFFACVMIIVMFIDIDHFIIPDRFSIGLIISGLILSAVIPFYPLNISYFYDNLATAWQLRLLNSFLGVLTGGLIFFIIFISAYFYYSRKGIDAFGFGDVKLAAGIGAFLGWKLTLFMIFAAFFIGGIIALPLVLFGRAGAKTQMPFAPAICISAILAFLCGISIINWYLNLIIIPI